jgi:hypothetical protein
MLKHGLFAASASCRLNYDEREQEKAHTQPSHRVQAVTRILHIKTTPYRAANGVHGAFLCRINT